MAAMRKRFSLFLSGSKNNLVLTNLRERLLRIMLYSSFVVGTVLFGLALIPVLQKGLYSTILIYSLLYAWTILITFVHRLPYRLRAIGWLGMLFAFGIINLVDSGFNVDSGLFLITFIAMTVLLMDVPAGLVAFVLDCAAISILGYINTTGNVILPVGLPQSDPLLWIIAGIIFLIMGVLLMYSLTIVVHGLEDNLAKATLLSDELEQTNETLRMSEERYRTLVETSPDIVLLFDLQGNVVMSNQVGLTLFGYERMDEVAGKNIVDFVMPDDQPRAVEAFQSILTTGGLKDFDCLAIKKDGSTFNAEYSGALLTDEAGGPQAVMGVGRDITVRKQAERLLQESKEALAVKVVETSVQLQQTASRLEELVRHGPTVIYSFRASDHAVTYMSENVTAMVGFEASEFIKDKNFWRAHVHPDDQARVFAQVDQPGSSDRNVFDYRFLKKDGMYCWLRGERMLMRDADGNPLEFVGSWIDITARKNTEETLRLSEARYRSLYDGMMDAYVTVDMNGRILQFNQAYQKMVDYEPRELRELTYNDLTPEKWQAAEAEITEKQVIGRGYSDIYEKEYIRKDGSIIPVELRAALIRDEAGNPAGMWALIRDISVRKIIEQTLRDSEARYRELLDNSMQGVIVFQDMRVVYTNQAVTESLGYTQEELNSLTPAEMVLRVHPDDRHTFLERLQNRDEDTTTPERYSLRIIHKNGEIRWIDARTVPILLEERPAMMTTAIDVSEIKRVETELQESERTQRSILNASDAMVFLADANGIIISTNDKLVQRLGSRVDALVGISVHGLFPEEVTRERKMHFNQVVSSGKPVIFEDVRNDTWFENNFYPVLDKSGKVVRVAAYIHDITEKRRMTEALRSSEEQYRTLAEAAHDMIFIINKDDCIEYVNSFGAQFLGQPPQTLVGQPRERFFPKESSLHQQDNIRKVFRSGEAVSSDSANIFPNQTVWLSTWLVPLKNAAGEVASVLGVSRDISNLKKSEEELRQARDFLEERVAERTAELSESQEKMRSLTAQTVKTQEEERRTISRELHDDAGQALITLQYSLAAVQNELPETETFSRKRLSDSLRVIDQTMQHIRSLAHSLRPPVLDIGGIDLSLQDYCREQTERTRIPIIYQGQDIPGLPDEISISLYRFVQEGLTNVLKHAQATQAKVRLQYKKGEISISVSDNGHGMEDPIPHGMGLDGIRERLKLLDGRLETHSTKGRGTRLVAYVPWTRPGSQST
jgi:PAS domain S-box-containing protein